MITTHWFSYGETLNLKLETVFRLMEEVFKWSGSWCVAAPNFSDRIDSSVPILLSMGFGLAGE
jgi:hypothetical protein